MDSIGTINLIIRFKDMFAIEFKDEDLVEAFSNVLILSH